MFKLIEAAPVYLTIVAVAALTILCVAYYFKAMAWLLKWGLFLSLSAAVVLLPFVAFFISLEWFFGWPEQVTLWLVMVTYFILLIRAAVTIFRKSRYENRVREG